MIDIKINRGAQDITISSLDTDESPPDAIENNSRNDFNGMSISNIDNTSETASSTSPVVPYLKTNKSLAEDAIEDMIIWMTVKEKNTVNRHSHVSAGLSAAQQASHSTERQRIMMLKREKRKSTDRRRRNRGAPHGIERRRSNRRVDRI